VRGPCEFFSLTILLGLGLVSGPLRAQIDESQTGAWYMYFFNAPFASSRWGITGDAQYRSWDFGGDLQQALLRSGVTWRTKDADAIFTLGYAYVVAGEFGSDSAKFVENRTYQDALLPQKIGERFYIRHRFRFEQRWIEDQDFRTRYRYTFFMDVPLNQTDLNKGAWYLSFFDEIFLNGQRDIGDDRTVEVFDQNWLYGAIGYSPADSLRLQAGYMHIYANAFQKGQIMLSLSQTF